ncbi:MAG: YihA family ribosome biogenesis GTP-binding protein [Bacteroidales bacterium]|nr:YihA family ribosome biogenesis GTP-binding protein [Bacteroidales bacterium]
MKLFHVAFICSSPNTISCPKDGKPEFAFVGRSNVGKSSLVNMLVNRRGVAKVSGTPGKTRLINHFLVDDTWYLVDLPGYGYAKISIKERQKIKEMIDNYILSRKEMRCLFVLIDSRLEPQKLDLEFLSFLGENEIPFFILFTKADKLSAVEMQKSIARYKRKLSSQWEIVPNIIPTSSKTKEGRDILIGIIEEVMEGKI